MPWKKPFACSNYNTSYSQSTLTVKKTVEEKLYRKRSFLIQVRCEMTRSVKMHVGKCLIIVSEKCPPLTLWAGKATLFSLTWRMKYQHTVSRLWKRSQLFTKKCSRAQGNYLVASGTPKIWIKSSSSVSMKIVALFCT